MRGIPFLVSVMHTRAFDISKRPISSFLKIYLSVQLQPEGQKLKTEDRIRVRIRD